MTAFTPLHRRTARPFVDTASAQRLRRATAAVLCASALLWASHSAQAQSELSVGLSLLPVASVVGTASAVGGSVAGVAALPVALLASGAVLTVKAVQASAQGTVIVLERASDAARVSVVLAGDVAGDVAEHVALSVGASVVSTVVAGGVILSAAGEVMAFIPDAIGEALLYSEQVFDAVQGPVR